MSARSQPSAEAGAHIPPSPQTPALYCDLCGEPMRSHEFSQAVRDTSGMDVCCLCLEEMTDASTLNARSEVGMVGGRG